VGIVKQQLKIEWVRKGLTELTATLKIMPRGYELGLAEQDIDSIQKWCEEHGCGTRTSFDTFRFRSQKEITLFLLKWA
jgi:hypothetical protein